MEDYSNYLTSIERFFAVARYSGFVLAPRDLEWVRQWYRRGIPLRLVLEGIAQGVENHRHNSPRGALPPHHLNYYRKIIEAHISRFQRDPMEGIEATSPEIAVDDDAAEGIAHAIAEARLLMSQSSQDLEREIHQKRLDDLETMQRQVLHGELDAETLWMHLQNLDDEILCLYDGGLDDETRQWLEQQLETRLGAEQGLSRRALAGRSVVLRNQLLRERLGLPDWNQ